ncbi:hypothetical protein [uncultured Treponema sp.]|uniref:hypothetical protein n=1 Tax=uncultured Treponema sp. TaxID=162155 RepID=UPI002587B302|nr:hypothetical protein [uncultured Treponema sp.]
MKKTFFALVVFLMLCVAAVSAKSSGLGSLGKNLSALSGNAKPAEGTVPEGREILPAIFAVMYSDASGSEKSDGHYVSFKGGLRCWNIHGFPENNYERSARSSSASGF